MHTKRYVVSGGTKIGCIILLSNVLSRNSQQGPLIAAGASDHRLQLPTEQTSAYLGHNFIRGQLPGLVVGDYH